MKQKTSAVNQITEVLSGNVFCFSFSRLCSEHYFTALQYCRCHCLSDASSERSACLCWWLFRTAKSISLSDSLSGFLRCNRHHYTLLWRKRIKIKIWHFSFSPFAIIGHHNYRILEFYLLPLCSQFIDTQSNVMTGSVIYLRIYFAGIFSLSLSTQYWFPYSLRAIGDSNDRFII